MIPEDAWNAGIAEHNLVGLLGDSRKLLDPIRKFQTLRGLNHALLFSFFVCVWNAKQIYTRYFFFFSI